MKDSLNATVLELQEADDDRKVSLTFKGSTFVEGNTVDTQELIDAPNVMPYWLDDETRRVLFVETPCEVDLSDAAFMAQAQFEHVRQLYAITYESWIAIRSWIRDFHKRTSTSEQGLMSS